MSREYHIKSEVNVPQNSLKLKECLRISKQH